MKLSNLLGQRFKEKPAECKLDSHVFLVRGGYIKQVGEGIFSMFMPMKRITKKIENIIREEMDAIGGQEVMFPVVMPATLWEESGRYSAVGSELLRCQDRGGSKLVLGMTHEEAAVHLARNTASSYINFPFMIYQIQTKFRDEPRSRGGLIRVREFTMKDAYSFHTSQQDLEDYYKKCHKAYENIFARVGVPEVISVQSDSGMMGGKVAHEFMLVTDAGEDKLVVCQNEECDFRANMEIAECVFENEPQQAADLTKVHTPNTKTIDDICKLLNVTPDKTAKAVIFLKKESLEPVIVFIRGDLDVNDIKLRNFLHEEVIPDDNTTETGITYGFVGPINLTAKATVLFDSSLKGLTNLVCGANEVDYHYTGFNPERDLDTTIEYHDLSKAFEGCICPKCRKKTIRLCRGIEVGNIFQLGTKYTESMNMQYIDKDGNLQNPIMGCYGIGVGRLAASVCEVRHDDYGPIWPISIAPWHVHICAIRADDPQVSEVANNIYNELQKNHIEVIFDDRDVRPGVMFNDADLLGVPVRVTVSPKTLKRNAVEVVFRDKSFSQDFPTSSASADITALVNSLLS